QKSAFTFVSPNDVRRSTRCHMRNTAHRAKHPPLPFAKESTEVRDFEPRRDLQNFLSDCLRSAVSDYSDKIGSRTAATAKSIDANQPPPAAWRLALGGFPKRHLKRSSPPRAAQGTRLPRHPKRKEIMNTTRNKKNSSFAMPADAAAIPPNPKTAAT